MSRYQRPRVHLGWALLALLVPASAFADTSLSGASSTDTNIAPGFDPALFVGSPGGDGNAVVTAPGPDTYSAVSIGQGGTGNVSVSGPGALLNATNIVQVGATTTGTLTIQNGGVVNSLGGLSPFCSPCNLTAVGNGAGSVGVLTVTGAGSQFNVGNTTPGAFFLVGNGGVSPGFGTPGAPTSGTINVLNGASMTTPGTQLGSFSLAAGTVNVDGMGSTWTVNPIGSTQDAFLNVGFNGIGNVNVTNGASINGPRFAIVGVNAGSVGTLTIDGNSAINMTGAFNNFGPAMHIGQTNGAVGTVSITNGGKLLIDGTNIPGAGAPGIIVGGSGAINVVGNGNGTLNVQGAGSQVIIKGDQEHTGSIISNTGLTVGQSGTGVMNITQGATLSIQDTSAAALGGLSIGGNILQSQLGQVSGTGSVLVSDPGSRIDVTAIHGGMAIGNNGPGTLTVANGGVVQIAGGASVGRNPGSTGNLTVTGLGSTFAVTGGLGIGTNGGAGMVSLHCGGSISAANISIGANATAGGCGTITGNVINNGTLQVGASPDQLHINGNYGQVGGAIKFEIDPDGHGGFLTSSLVLKAGSTFSVSGATIDFSFLNGADPRSFAASGEFNLDTFFRIDDPNALGGTDPLSSELANGALLDSLFTGAMMYDAIADGFDITQFSFDTNTGVSQLATSTVPEPATLALFGVGLAGLGLMRRRKRSVRA